MLRFIKTLAGNYVNIDNVNFFNIYKLTDNKNYCIYAVVKNKTNDDYLNIEIAMFINENQAYEYLNNLMEKINDQ